MPATRGEPPAGELRLAVRGCKGGGVMNCVLMEGRPNISVLRYRASVEEGVLKVEEGLGRKRIGDGALAALGEPPCAALSTACRVGFSQPFIAELSVPAVCL